MTRFWTETDKMMVIIGKLSERIDILEFIQNKQDNEIERMRNVMRSSGELAMPQPQRRKKSRRYSR